MQPANGPTDAPEEVPGTVKDPISGLSMLHGGHSMLYGGQERAPKGSSSLSSMAELSVRFQVPT